MDDLSSLDWNASKAAPSGQQPSGPKGNYYPTLRPTPPISGRSTPSVPSFPSSAQKPLSNVPTGSRGSTPANDSFANLVSFNAPQPAKNLSLQEQQRVLQEQKAKEEADRRKQFDKQFGPQTLTSASWNTLGDGRSTPNRVTGPPTYSATDEYGGQKLSKVINKPFAGIPAPSRSPAPTTPANDEKEEDILAAFNASAPVDKSSHMPPSSHTSSFDRTTNGATLSAQKTGGTANGSHAEEDDDDPFGLGMGGSKSAASQSSIKTGDGPVQDDDDVLGLLSRPVSEFPKKAPKKEAIPQPSESTSDNPRIRALKELADMGFEPKKCSRALEATESGTDVQAAVGWLLNQAHEESKQKSKKSGGPSKERDGSEGPHQARRAPTRRTSSSAGGAKSAWVREQERAGAGSRRQDSKSPAKGEKDPAQYASELSSSLFKTANSLWKTGQKKLNQAVSELNSAESSDTSQPKWMKETQPDPALSRPRPQQRENDAKDHDREAVDANSRLGGKQKQQDVTDEALLLESGGGPPSRKNTTRTKNEPSRRPTESFGDDLQLRMSNRRKEVLPQPKFLQQTQARDPRSKLSRQAVEEEAAAAYISPARRKKTTPKPQPPEPEPDLLFGESKPPPQPVPSPARPPVASKPRPAPAKSLTSRPPPPKRTIPPVSSIAVQNSTVSRKAGTEAFKRGDYGLATTKYTSALGALPPTHPLTIVILTNRALSHSKTGDPKASIADATTTIDFIGPSRGAGETIDLGGDEGIKPMETYWGKAMTRKAEGLEHLERWADAASVWRSCVEAGVGGATSIAGRNRCESAAKPKPPPAVKKAPPRPKPSALSDLTPESAQSAEAVTRLRAANAAADQLDDEKFRLADIVDGRVSRWRTGKEGNLRALLASLENVLWEDAGWKKTGMGELIQTNKVKIVYMRGIGKVHPDKLPTTATTEQQMISAAVFATLNEAWERFKMENGL